MTKPPPWKNTRIGGRSTPSGRNTRIGISPPGPGTVRFSAVTDPGPSPSIITIVSKTLRKSAAFSTVHSWEEFSPPSV